MKNNCRKMVMRLTAAMLLGTMIAGSAMPAMAAGFDTMYMCAPLKSLMNDFFGCSKQVNSFQSIYNKINDLEIQINQAEAAIKNHVDRVASLTAIGGDFQKMVNAATPLKRKIEDIERAYENNLIAYERRIQMLAALYESREYTSLVNAVNGATNAFIGNTSYSLNEECDSCMTDDRNRYDNAGSRTE